MTDKFKNIHKNIHHINISFKDFINEKLNDKLKYGIPYYPAILPPNDINKCKKIMIDYCKNDIWVTDKKENMTTYDVLKELEDMGKEGENILKHEVIHALQYKKAKYLLNNKNHNNLEMDEYLKFPSEIMAFAYSYVIDDMNSNHKEYEKIGGNVYKLFLHYVDEYKKLLK